MPTEHRERPDKVTRAIAGGDKEALSFMGHLGGKATQKARRIKKARLAKDMWEMRVQANEHIICIDGNDGPYPDGRIPF